MFFPALLDANVLVPIRLTDLTLRLAEAETYRPLWSEQVLDEAERNLPKVGLTADQARRRMGFLRSEFPDAMVTDFEPLIDAMTNDPKDRHVLAAAVRANAEIIVTANVKDFPAKACDPYDITVVSPDEFLLDQLDLYEAETLQCLRELVEDRTRPPTSMPEFLEQFRKTVPNFVDEVTPLLTR
ncbi:putative toxin-antitoxin system toxin component, PIN family [Prauserella oleivorans]|uniref:Toxin-antitoxin system toxin component, PIN family n=1 Tax=Prauserella oleivorans TaxID=1478153 RepID=A0ABW5WJD2_9PSEU